MSTTVPRKLAITGSQLRAEGVLEVGRVPDTNLVFVKTEARLVLFMADQVNEVIFSFTEYELERARELFRSGYRYREVCELLRIPYHRYMSGSAEFQVMAKQLRGIRRRVFRPPSHEDTTE